MNRTTVPSESKKSGNPDITVIVEMIDEKKLNVIGNCEASRMEFLNNENTIEFSAYESILDENGTIKALNGNVVAQMTSKEYNKVKNDNAERMKLEGKTEKNKTNNSTKSKTKASSTRAKSEEPTL